MGMAASQARFLGITARKASCEFKSTEIAQQKLEITNQLSDISVDYANAMNSTKLIWQNEAATYDYGASYGLLMTPSAMNNYNAYMVTTNTGAIVLNSAYAAAAKLRAYLKPAESVHKIQEIDLLQHLFLKALSLRIQLTQLL